MEFSDVLATTALVVSIVSAWLSHRSHRESVWLGERERRREFDRERSEFLIRIERSTKTLEQADACIRNLLTQIRNQQDWVKQSLEEAVEQLERDRAYLEGCLRQARALWEENFESTHDGLAFHKARHLALLEDDERFAAQALERASKTEESLRLSLSLADR